MAGSAYGRAIAKLYGMTIAKQQERYATLQLRARQSNETLRQFKIDLAVKYGSHQYGSQAEQAKKDRLDKRATRDANAFYNFVLTISPRDWSTTVPFHWIVSQLTYADAVTRGPLSVIPPPAYGYLESDSRTFAGEVRS